MTFVGKLGPWWADETREGNGAMCGCGRGEASGEEGAAERALGEAAAGLHPASEVLGAMGEVSQQAEGVGGEQM